MATHTYETSEPPDSADANMPQVYTSELQESTSFKPSNYQFVERNEYPVGTTVRLAGGDHGWVVQTGRKTMIKLRSQQVREAKGQYSIISGLFHVPQE